MNICFMSRKSEQSLVLAYRAYSVNIDIFMWICVVNYTTETVYNSLFVRVIGGKLR
jgi:hypothetical protein